MKQGKVLVYSDDVGAGVIVSDDGEHHVFFRTQWQSLDTAPLNDLEVTFLVGTGHACHVNLKPGLNP